ncbi:hypothetical protein KC363_g3886 [Hortaea werneckii]|nr:hypothetical protein KC325_g2558 [Hortaea werneckii]KAI6996704.1 hypothetical protein KC359_g3290 [Hortaea werneckii]KAI7148024.1 hypothetical protein KC344_g2277 [Hortaea werneckii]KAI7177544.1 hypothetical protein KC360_g2240 [Hortaea werneckii]KAI7191334.1 hypothetical protein KC363_g3886 [Hortaea werneckii]
MAVAIAHQPVTMQQVLMWICSNIEYYRNLALFAFATEAPLSPAEKLKMDIMRQFRIQVKYVPYCYDLGVNKATKDGERDTYTMTAAACEKALHRVVRPVKPLDRGSFRFFDLPAELRNRIYDLVFHYPQNRLLFARTPKGRASLHVGQCPKVAVGGENTCVATAWTSAISDIFAPLLVNKQLYEEARTVFFAINRFDFWNLTVANKILAKMTRFQRQHVHDIGFFYQPTAANFRLAESAMTHLAFCGLKKFTLCFSEVLWSKYLTAQLATAIVQGVSVPTQGFVIQEKYGDVRDMPGFHILRALRGLTEVTFDGCPTVESLLREDMLTPQPDQTAPRGKKRKANETGDEDDESEVWMGDLGALRSKMSKMTLR